MSAHGSGAGALYYLGVFIFILSLVATGGVFAYKKLVERSIENLKSQVASARASLDTRSIEELLAYDNKLKSVTAIVDNHVAMTQYFEMLEESTVSKVRFKSLKYNNLGGIMTVEMQGVASGYSTIALQEDVLLKNNDARTVIFDTMKLDKKTGSVSFTMKSEFNRNLIKFKVPEVAVLQGPTTE